MFLKNYYFGLPKSTFFSLAALDTAVFGSGIASGSVRGPVGAEIRLRQVLVLRRLFRGTGEAETEEWKFPLRRHALPEGEQQIHFLCGPDALFGK